MVTPCARAALFIVGIEQIRKILPRDGDAAVQEQIGEDLERLARGRELVSLTVERDLKMPK